MGWNQAPYVRKRQVEALKSSEFKGRHREGRVGVQSNVTYSKANTFRPMGMNEVQLGWESMI